MSGAGLRYPVAARLGAEHSPEQIRRAIRLRDSALAGAALRAVDPAVASLAEQVTQPCLREALLVAESRRAA